ncbi:DNA methyltransferase [Undibacterium sp. Dicai25W]|uniref:DNA methyltransferase n=1 Tax=Undibacterium sp. Dicai25W TaxID=3413034 RepID=UPI003BEF84E7
MAKAANLQDDLFEDVKIYEKFLPLINKIEGNDGLINEWDIPHTITQLSYLTHNHYRYYGKFPSVVAGQLLEQYLPPTPSHYVIDNFCGSGTTLVEAKLRGIKSYGVDISWISALVSEVKTKHINLSEVKALLLTLKSASSANDFKSSTLNAAFAEKWFSENVIIDLYNIQQWLLSLPKSSERNFLLVGFLAIVRRVSLAHDAEVRPHINPAKKQRNVLQAYYKKIKDMLETHTEYQSLSKKNVVAECYVADNKLLPNKFSDKKCYLLISHPPYLNSFNYRPVFSLEFLWGNAFENEFVHESSIGLIKDELVAHPANETNTEKYFQHLTDCYKASYPLCQDRCRVN